MNTVNMPKMQYSDRLLHIFLPRSTNPTIRLVMSEAKPTGNSAKPARARLPPPVENSITQSLKQSSRHGQAAAADGVVSWPVRPLPDSFFTWQTFRPWTVLSEFGECSADG